MTTSIHTAAARAFAFFGGYALAAAAVAAWSASRAGTAPVDPQIIRDYLGLMTLVSAGFLGLAVLPSFRTWIAAVSIGMAFLTSIPAAFDRPSVAEDVTLLYLRTAGIAVAEPRS